MVSPIFAVYFLILLVIGVPVLFALGLSPAIALLQADKVLFMNLLYQRLYAGLDNFLLLALPFFMLAGEFMVNGGITTRIISFSQKMVQHMRGGLGHVVIISATLFGALTGSSVAATSAIGNMMIPEMERFKYDRTYAAAITAAATVLGTIIPPSGIMLIYAFVMNTSVAAMFMSGIVPGLILCIALMLVNRWQILKYPAVEQFERAPRAERSAAFKAAILPLADTGHYSGRHLWGHFHANRSGGSGGLLCLCPVRLHHAHFEAQGCVPDVCAHRHQCRRNPDHCGRRQRVCIGHLPFRCG